MPSFLRFGVLAVAAPVFAFACGASSSGGGTGGAGGAGSGGAGCSGPGESIYGYGDNVFLCCAQPASCTPTGGFDTCCGFTECAAGPDGGAATCQ